MTVRSPRDIDELMVRARALAGRDLAQLAAQQGVPVPESLRRHKGWVGTLLEQALGATAGSRSEPDFPALGVELKTLPVDHIGRPTESTWVCTAPLDGSLATRWADSWVRRKLARVLWVPVVAAPDVPLVDRRVGAPMLWTMEPDSEAVLCADWEELTELIRLGQIDEIDARRGRWLQLRPKAANGKVTRWVLDADAEWVRATPRGFYLRTAFTQRLLQRYWVLPNAVEA